MKLNDEDEEGEERGREKKTREWEQQKVSDVGQEKDVEEVEDPKPVGNVVRVSGRGRGRQSHYEAYEYDGVRFDLEDPVLVSPEKKSEKPYIAILKDITQKKDGSMDVTGQWFYRPEEAKKEGGGNWQSRDTRELFYSFHLDSVPAETVMHKCVVHFIPLNKQIPNRKQHPGFIVQKVYDTGQKRLLKLTGKHYEENQKHEIDVLVQKTLSRLGDLLDIETGDAPTDQEDQLKNGRLGRKNMSPVETSRGDEAGKSGQSVKVGTPESLTNTASEYYTILSNFKALTGETQRDKWLERLLQGMQVICSSTDNEKSDDIDKGRSHSTNQTCDRNSESANGSQDNRGGTTFVWPDAAVSAVTALEKAAHDTLSSDSKYNQKMRTLLFNLKKTALLARRLLNGELEPSKILSMSPVELKEGLTAEEIASKKPEESKSIQMTDARCKRCMEKKVGVTSIIKAGLGEHYQLECIACGNTWYASIDKASTLTIDGPSTYKSVGTAPWATTKFEDVEKKVVTPGDSEKSADDIFKTTKAYMPVLDTHKPFNNPRTEDKC
ncbi:uncharacterized protein LOC130792992 isoform X1 [Actinidia eriantha]|uniref:uncharacterized protein LOC130792992 isoform X1 n=1 Tax=Actinidia eriantha TaxID=165200 RepID=UPI0025881BCA|nr:uncharacterized protein LOC130792992 isoform X1 [Actinidia eriantha]